VLLPRVVQDLKRNKRLNYHLYQARVCGLKLKLLVYEALSAISVSTTISIRRVYETLSLSY
jgi:hypothetical protein